MGSAIPQVMLAKLLGALGMASETTLHDIRWGSEYNGTFYWDLEISGAVPFAIPLEVSKACTSRDPGTQEHTQASHAG